MSKPWPNPSLLLGYDLLRSNGISGIGVVA
jgi:hypothetical protein